MSAIPTDFRQPDGSIGRAGNSCSWRRELRKLRPDAELFCRRARGEFLRALADYGMRHSTLPRFMERLER